MTYQDLEAAAGLVQEQEAKERMQEIANALAKGMLRGELSAHWWLSLDEISYIGDFDGPDKGMDNSTRDSRDYLHGESVTDGSTVAYVWGLADIKHLFIGF